jgi:hypothetical protein
MSHYRHAPFDLHDQLHAPFSEIFGAIKSIPLIPSMRTRGIPSIQLFISSTLLMLACSPTPDSRPDTTRPTAIVQLAKPRPAALNLIDSTIAPAVANQAGWNYSQTASEDLDGDGQPEKVILTARVELIRGRPAWDDGQPWQVYIEEADGTRTYVFSRFVQLGTLSLRVSAKGSEHRPVIVLLEQLPDRMSVYEVEYSGPQRVRVTVPYERDLDAGGDVSSPTLP